MPVMRGSLRSSSDGSIKSFVIILTFIGFMFFVYYKLKMNPNCLDYVTALRESRVEANRLKLINQALRDQIELQKTENSKLVSQENIKAAQLDAARTSDSDKFKEIEQLRSHLKIANEKLKNNELVSNKANSCYIIQKQYEQKITDLKDIIFKFNHSKKSKRTFKSRHGLSNDSAKQSFGESLSDLKPIKISRTFREEYHTNEKGSENIDIYALPSTVEFIRRSTGHSQQRSEAIPHKEEIQSDTKLFYGGAIEAINEIKDHGRKGRLNYRKVEENEPRNTNDDYQLGDNELSKMLGELDKVETQVEKIRKKPAESLNHSFLDHGNHTDDKLPNENLDFHIQNDIKKSLWNNQDPKVEDEHVEENSKLVASSHLPYLQHNKPS